MICPARTYAVVLRESLPPEDLTVQAPPDTETAKPARAVNAVTASSRAEWRLNQAENEALLAVYSI